MFKLKPIEPDAVPAALAKAERYRLLNEPREAESICHDVLAADPDNQQAVICLILTLTDLFDRTARRDDAVALLARLKGDYEREYYAGVIEERWVKHLLTAGYAMASVYDRLRKAMDHFEKSDRIAPPSNDDAVLRWNTCVRLLQRENFNPDEEPEHPEIFEDDVPVR